MESLPPPIYISSAEHGISSKSISPAAREVISQLQKAGFQAYIVGGGVRDLLLGHHPKDFDVATDAKPEEVQTLFKRCFLIGRRFRLAHVHVDRQIIEVATFRGSSPIAEPEAGDEPSHHTHEVTGLVLRDNIYGSLAEDAWRRDFSLNALYYDPKTGDIIDYTGGFADLQNRTLQIIGNPEQRYREDPVRMLRAIRFKGKLGFELHADSERPIPHLAHLLSHVSSARLFEEFNKLFLHGCAFATYQLLHQYKLAFVLFPSIKTAFSEENADTEKHQKLIEAALQSTDERVKKNKPVTPAFLFAAFLWSAYVKSAANYQKHHHQSPYFSGISAANEVLSEQSRHVLIPRRLSLFIRETWQLQPKLTQLRRRIVLKTLVHSRFRAAYDFLSLRAKSGEAYENVVQWWTDFQEGNEKKRGELLKHLSDKPRKKKSATADPALESNGSKHSADQEP